MLLIINIIFIATFVFVKRSTGALVRTRRITLVVSIYVIEPVIKLWHDHVERNLFKGHKPACYQALSGILTRPRPARAPSHLPAFQAPPPFPPSPTSTPVRACQSIRLVDVCVVIALSSPKCAPKHCHSSRSVEGWLGCASLQLVRRGGQYFRQLIRVSMPSTVPLHHSAALNGHNKISTRLVSFCAMSFHATVCQSSALKSESRWNFVGGSVLPFSGFEFLVILEFPEMKWEVKGCRVFNKRVFTRVFPVHNSSTNITRLFRSIRLYYVVLCSIA